VDAVAGEIDDDLWSRTSSVALCRLLE